MMDRLNTILAEYTLHNDNNLKQGRGIEDKEGRENYGWNAQNLVSHKIIFCSQPKTKTDLFQIANTP